MSEFLTDHSAWIALALLALMFASFIAERLSPSATAVAGAAAFLALGFVTEEESLGAFANSAPVSIGAMFILAAALQRTGVLEFLASRILAMAEVSSLAAICMIGLIAVAGSAFVNNTAVVVVMLPVVIELGQRLSLGRKKVLIPLSYISILGGTLTLIGTSTNLIVSGVAEARGLARFGIFEMTVVGAVTLGACLTFLVVFGRWLLPRSEGDEDEGEKPLWFLTDLFPSEDSKAIGSRPEDVSALKSKGVSLLSHRRGNRLLNGEDEDRMIAEKDRLSVRATLEELLTLARSQAFRTGLRVRKAHADAPIIAQATVAATDSNIGRPLAQVSYLSDYPITVRGIARIGNLAGPTLSTCRLRAGDRLLLEGSEATLRSLASSSPLLIDRAVDAVPFRRGHAPIAVATIAGVILASAMFGVPLAMAAIIGVGIALMTGCISAEGAWKSLQANVLILIVAMLIVGRGMEASGALDLIVSAASPILLAASPFFVLLAIYALTSILTELITNAAVAAILTPLVIGLAGALEVDPRALVLAVMFGASASFASPIGYQTNTIVYQAGSYRFADFLRVGIPMNIIAGFASCWAIWMFFM